MDQNNMKDQAMGSNLAGSSIPSRESSLCTHSEVGMSLIFSGNSKKTSEGGNVAQRGGCSQMVQAQWAKYVGYYH